MEGEVGLRFDVRGCVLISRKQSNETHSVAPPQSTIPGNATRDRPNAFVRATLPQVLGVCRTNVIPIAGRMERAERAHTGSVGASVHDAARAHRCGAAERPGSRTRGHPPVRRPAAALPPEAHEELRRLLLMDAASLSAQLPELSPRLDGYRVMRELLGVAMSQPQP